MTTINSAPHSNRLPILAAEIRKAHADVQDAAKTAAQRAIDAGHALIEAKKLIKHGEWLPWLRENCALAERTAQLYMKIAKSGHTSDIVAALGLKAAEKTLTLKYCWHRPMFDGEEQQQREWRLFALFLVKSRLMHPICIVDHIDWIGRKDFQTVEEWLTDGVKWSRSWRRISDKERRASELFDKELLAKWQEFEENQANLSFAEIEAAFEAEAAKAPPSQTLKRRRRRKSAMVADLAKPAS